MASSALQSTVIYIGSEQTRKVSQFCGWRAASFCYCVAFPSPLRFPHFSVLCSDDAIRALPWSYHPLEAISLGGQIQISCGVQLRIPFVVVLSVLFSINVRYWISGLFEAVILNDFHSFDLLYAAIYHESTRPVSACSVALYCRSRG
jgi:hypothetical protein